MQGENEPRTISERIFRAAETTGFIAVGVVSAVSLYEGVTGDKSLSETVDNHTAMIAGLSMMAIGNYLRRL